MAEVESADKVAQRILGLSAWEPRAALENATAYVECDRRDHGAAIRDAAKLEGKRELLEEIRRGVRDSGWNAWHVLVNMSEKYEAKETP